MNEEKIQGKLDAGGSACNPSYSEVCSSRKPRQIVPEIPSSK
jgi:hypothetical protein